MRIRPRQGKFNKHAAPGDTLTDFLSDMGSTPISSIKKQPYAVSRHRAAFLCCAAEESNSPSPPQRGANQPGGLFARARETPISVPGMPVPYPGTGCAFYAELLRSRTARPRRKIPRRGGVTPPYGAMYKKRVRIADTPNLHSKLSTLNSAQALHFRQYRKNFFSIAPRIVHIVYCFTALKCAIL